QRAPVALTLAGKREARRLWKPNWVESSTMTRRNFPSKPADGVCAPWNKSRAMTVSRKAEEEMEKRPARACLESERPVNPVILKAILRSGGPPPATDRSRARRK